MRRLFIADVHANLPAFEEVLRDVGPIDEVIFLGDIVGYGPHPAQCVELLQRVGARAILGNHDVEIIETAPSPENPDEPVDWLHWTRRRLSEEHLNYLDNLTARIELDSSSGPITLIHHPPDAPYLHPKMPDAVLGRHCRKIDGQTVFFGHSHRAFDRVIDGQRLVCIPPVGQPRDGDPRAGYALQTGEGLFFHRVEYDVEIVVADIRAIGLDRSFTDRWIEFVRTGYDEEWSREYRRS